MTGLHTGLRISDILDLRVRDVEGTHLMIEEQKTGKYKRIIITPVLRKILKFQSRIKTRTGKDKLIDRTTSYIILKDAAKAIGYTEPIGTHSLRKTFGYTFYEKYKDIGA